MNEDGDNRKWISVHDKLPKVEEGHYYSTVLVYASGNYMAVRDFNKDTWYRDGKPDPNIITHWMPLPSKPLKPTYEPV